MKRILVIISFLLALNFVACTYYGGILVNAEELVETHPLKDILEKLIDEKSDFLISSFRFPSLLIEKEESFYSRRNSEIFSFYAQDILLPPPDFFRFSA